MAGVELKDITKSFGQTQVLHGIDLTIGDGEFVVLVGPSGCGKSTLLRVLAGLEDVDGGEILIGDRRVNDLPPAKRGIAMVFQSYALYPNMSVRQNMGFGLKLAGKSRAEVDSSVQHAAEMLGIDHLLERRPKALSGGQRQRVAIGRAIVREPIVFLFDEPLSNLDAELRVRMRYEFAKLHQRLKTTTVYVTHDQVEAMTLADRIAILDRGRLVQMGSPQSLYEAPANLFVAGFIGSPRMNFMPGTLVSAAAEGAVIRLRSGAEVRAAVDASGLGAGAEMTLGVRPEHLRPGAGIAANVTLVESLGNVRFAYLSSDASGDPLIIQLAPSDRMNEGEAVGVAADPAHCHAFAADGQALPRLPASPDALAA